MKVLFIGDYVSIHQKAFCDAMYEHLKDKFVFMATTRISEARRQMGWVDYTKNVPYSVYNKDFSKTEIWSFVKQFDFVILGSSHEKRITALLKRKLVFYYQERPLKSGVKELLKPKRMWSLLQMKLRQSRNTHLLAASAFCYEDYKKLGCFKNRAWKWGYFIDPICNSYVPRIHQKTRILWTGRMIALKRCELMIEGAKFLQENHCDFVLDIIGSGEDEQKLKELVELYHLNDKVNFLGRKSNQEVRAHMQNADIFVATSDQHEGWGVVINEAMSAGCCVVASNAMGAAPFLIRHKKNGILFESENELELNKALLTLVRDKSYREKLGREALRTMNQQWSPNNAAKRLILLGESILNYTQEEFAKQDKDSPCSRADSKSDC